MWMQLNKEEKSNQSKKEVKKEPLQTIFVCS